MARNKVNDIDSFSGMFQPVPEPVKVPEEQQLKNKSQEVTKETQTFKIKPQKTAKNIKKPGRPKVNRETKKRYTFTLLPSVYEQAVAIAYENGKSISELV